MDTLAVIFKFFLFESAQSRQGEIFFQVSWKISSLGHSQILGSKMNQQKMGEQKCSPNLETNKLSPYNWRLEDEFSFREAIVSGVIC